MTKRRAIPAHAVEIRPDEPYTPEEWDFLCAAAERTMADPAAPPGRGVACAGGSVCVWTDSPDPLACAQVVATLNRLFLKRHVSGRDRGYALHRHHATLPVPAAGGGPAASTSPVTGEGAHLGRERTW